MAANFLAKQTEYINGHHKAREEREDRGWEQRTGHDPIYKLDKSAPQHLTPEKLLLQ